MRIDRLSIWVALVALGCVVAMPAWALDGPSTPPLRAESEASGETSEMIAFEGEVAATAKTCLGFGEFDDLHAGTDRYRGDRFRIETEDVELLEIRIELRFRGTVELYYSIHRSKSGSESPSYKRVVDFPDVIVTASGDGVAEFYSSGLLDGLILERGYDYAIGVSWTETDSAVNGSVTYGRDERQYPIPFLHGQVMGPVARNLPPPMDDDLGNLEGFSELAYSMELCFAPVDGACCCWELSGSVCEEMLESDCIGAGCHFFGERVQCNEVVCDFGACCFPCGECGDNYTAEACEADGGSKHWSNMDCIDPEFPDALCPEIFGACCTGGTCTDLCLDDCLAIGGVYRGDDTSCEPNNICVGACCFEGGCAELTGSFCEWPFGVYRGDGTECVTLPPDLECGGACCWTIETTEGCQDVANRAECTIAGGVSEPLYAGAGTQCIDEPCSHLGTCSGDVTLLCGTDDECLGYCNLVPSVLCADDQECVAAEAGTRCIGYSGGTCNLFPLGKCCLPDGTCLYTTEAACEAEVPGERNFTEDVGGLGPERVCENQDPDPCPTLPCCFRDGTCQVLTANACLGLGGISDGTVDDTCDMSCSDVYDPGACCGMGLRDCTYVPEADCLAADGVYMGDLIPCPDQQEDALCLGFGACCREEDGDCFDKYTSDECGVIGGVYEEDESTCDTLDPQCDQRGACCTETGACLFVLQSECETITGTADAFVEVGEPCVADLCPIGACCFDGTCEVVGGEAYCKLEDGRVYQDDDSECTLDLCTIGACCFDDGGCEDRVESECPIEEGMFDAEFTCAADLCEPIGACCKRDGGCLDDVKESECASICGELTAEVLCNTLDPPCTPIGACCYADATCVSDVRQGDCESDGGVFTVGADCSDIPPCEGRRGCCKDGECYDDMTLPECEFLGGVYLEDEPVCYSWLCTLGACCHLDGNCGDDRIRSQCEGPNDQFSYGFLCENISCPARGACCVGDEGAAVCQLMTFADCYDVSGEYGGDGTLCLENLCQTVACCTVTEACENVTRRLCERDGGAYMGAEFTCNTTGTTPGCQRGACCEPDETCNEWKVQIECNDPDDFRLWEGCTQCEGRGACCLPDDPGGEFCQILTRAECLDNYGTYAGDASVCQPDDLCIFGACCMSFGVCDIRTRHSCETAEGFYHGADTDCASFECILGACCLPDETCETRTGPHCEMAEGTYLGVYTDCLDVNCTLGSCCYLNGDFAVTVQSECAGAGDTFEAGLTCGDPAWCKPRGACCEGDTCTIMPQAQCEAGGSRYLGNGVLCEPDTCFLPEDGACCRMTGECVESTVISECMGPEEVFEPGMTCVDITCEPRGACCEGATCTIKTQAQCETDGGTYIGTEVLCEPGTCAPEDIVDSSPQNCLIDARQPSQTDGTEPAGWSVIEITFTSDASSLMPEDFTVRVEPGPATAPVITAVVATGTPETVALELDGPIPTGQWTCFTYVHTGSEVCLGYLPADTNGDGTAAPSDILRVIDCLNAVATCGTHQCDIDRSLVCGPPDILRVIDLLNGAGVYDTWLNVALPACPSAP